MVSEKKITREFKKTLTKAERKEFRSRMWEFRRDKKDLTRKERAKLQALFERLPRLKTLYELRQRFKQIFDTDQTKEQASLRLTELFGDATDEFPSLMDFERTYEKWEDQILAYFDKRETSGVVEGINNKARVITKRCYGIKSAESLWTRLILDLNRARQIVQHTIAGLRAVIEEIRCEFV